MQTKRKSRFQRMIVYNKSVMASWKETTKTFTRKKYRDCL
jgi:hypothetical protein